MANEVNKLKKTLKSWVRNNEPKIYEGTLKYQKHFKQGMKWSVLLWHYMNDIKEIPKCKVCGGKVRIPSARQGYRDYCSTKCLSICPEMIEIKRKTNIERYGVDNPSKSKEIRKKVEETNIKKFGAKYPLMNKDIMEENKNKFIEKYGVDNPSKVEEFKNKRIKTILKKYGVDNYAKTEQYKIRTKEIKFERYGDENYTNIEKCKQTNLERYGVEFVLQNEDIKNKIKETNLERYGFEYCSQSDAIKERVKKTNLERYGVECNLQLEETKNQIKKTNLERYGVEYPSQSDEIKDKTKHTNLERYGVECVLKSDLIKEKIKEVNLKKFGFEYAAQSDVVKNKIKQTNLERYGVDCVFENENIKYKIKQTNLEKYNTYEVNSEGTNQMWINCDRERKKHFKVAQYDNYIKYLGNEISLFKCDQGEDHTFEISSSLFNRRKNSNIPLCTICNEIGNNISHKENELYKYIKCIYDGEIITSYRDKIEIDIYLPELNIGFEFNGLYWHSDKYKEKDYHFTKNYYFEERGIKIIHVWEDDWETKSDIIKSQIKSLLNNINIKYYARKCSVKKINKVKKFLENNHLGGYCPSNINYGLYYNNELVSVMTFIKEKDTWILSRFCNKLNTIVVGGASKLFKHFIRKNEPTNIVSYSNLSYSTGNLYNILGFKKEITHKPECQYINVKTGNKKTRNKEKITKLKIYDCGKDKYVYNQL